MRTVIVEARGGSQVLQLVERPTPEPGVGEVLIAVEAMGVNWADVMQREGHYPDVLPLPYAPGHEVVGRIQAVGEGVSDHQVGQRVAAIVPVGGYAEYALAPAVLTVPVPAALAPGVALALLVQGLTAFLLAEQTVKAGDRVLVTAAAGGVGSLLLQVVRLFGAELVVGAAGGPEKCQLVEKFGAQALDYRQPDWATTARERVGALGFNCVLDAVGGATRVAAYGLLADYGRFVLYGGLAAVEEPWPGGWEPLVMRNQSVHGYAITRWIAAHPEFVSRATAQLGAWVEQGVLEACCYPAYPLAEVQRAHQEMEGRVTQGKVLLVP